MIKVLFVCHGNICRSPMAEYVMKDLVAKTGRGGEFSIASAAVSREELGNPVYPPAGGSWQSTVSPATVMPPIRSPGRSWKAMTGSTIWIAAMPNICGGCSGLTQPSASRCCPVMWRIPGTPGISAEPGMIF